MQLKSDNAHKSSSQSLAILLGVFIFFIAPSALAVPNVAEMIENIANTIPQLKYLVFAISYVMGFYFIIHGVLLLKKYGLQRTNMSGDASMTPAMLYLFVGAALIYLPSTIFAGIGTFWSDDSPYKYDTGGSSEWDEFYNACFLIIQLIGIIAFIRGLVMLTKLGGSGGGQQGGGPGKAAAHLVGGIFCINLYPFIEAVFTTLGLGSFLE